MKKFIATFAFLVALMGAGPTAYAQTTPVPCISPDNLKGSLLEGVSIYRELSDPPEVSALREAIITRYELAPDALVDFDRVIFLVKRDDPRVAVVLFKNGCVVHAGESNLYETLQLLDFRAATND